MPQEALRWHSLSLDAVPAEQEVTKTDMFVAPHQRALGTPVPFSMPSFNFLQFPSFKLQNKGTICPISFTKSSWESHESAYVTNCKGLPDNKLLQHHLQNFALIKESCVWIFGRLRKTEETLGNTFSQCFVRCGTRALTTVSEWLLFRKEVDAARVHSKMTPSLLVPPPYPVPFFLYLFL